MAEAPSELSNPPALVVPHCTVCGLLLQRLLNRVGYSAAVVRGGEAAVRRGLELRPQAAFVDLNLQDEDGLEIGRLLRAGLGVVRLVAVAPAWWDGEPTRPAEAGFDGWLRKPIQAVELLRLLVRAEAIQ